MKILIFDGTSLWVIDTEITRAKLKKLKKPASGNPDMVPPDAGTLSTRYCYGI